MSTGLIADAHRGSLVVTGLSAWTAAGDVRGLAAAVEAGVHAFTEVPPYPADGLSNPRTGQITNLDRERPAEALLEHVVREALAEAAQESGPQGRTGLVVGTSSGNICGPWERWHRAFLAGEATEADEAGTGRDAPTLQVARTLGLDGPVATVSVACVSGTAVLAVAEGWLRDGICDRVVVAGVDALSLFVHAGFSGLGALASELPRPFQDDRDGLVLGEGAAALVLERATDPATEREVGDAEVFLGGVGMSADAVHMTAPDRHAGGAIRALRAAMGRSGHPPGDVETISVHGTSTRFNDAMEQVALDAVFGANPPEMQLVKRSVGHTMGAAGAIEAALAVHTLRSRQGVLPSMSSAFGGMNACAVFQTAPPPPVEPHPTTVAITLESDGALARSWPDAPVSAKRGSRSVRAAIVGLRDLVAAHGPIEPGTAVVMSTRTGCRPTDLRYHERLVREGAGRVSRLAFAYTVPAAPICEASLLLGLQGPLLTFLGPPELALEEATRLVRWGHAPAAIAIDIEAGEAPHAVSLVRRPHSSTTSG